MHSYEIESVYLCYDLTVEMTYFIVDYGTMIQICKHKIISKYSQDRQIHASSYVTQLDNKGFNDVASPVFSRCIEEPVLPKVLSSKARQTACQSTQFGLKAQC